MSGQTDLLERVDQSEETEGMSGITSPTDIAMQIRALRYPPIRRAGAKDGSAYMEVYLLQEGLAYRPFGSQDDQDWKWALAQQFEKNYEVVTFVGDELEMQQLLIEKLIHLSKHWRQRFQIAFKSMGKRSRRRLGQQAAESLALAPPINLKSLMDDRIPE